MGIGVAVPHDNAFRNGIEVGDHQHGDEDSHGGESGAVFQHNILESKGPGIEEHYLKVKDEEEDSHHVVFDGEEGGRALPFRQVAAFVRHILCIAELGAAAEDDAQHDNHASEAKAGNQLNQR